MNVTAISSCHAVSPARRWSSATDRRDRSLDGDRVDVRTGFDGDAYIPSSVGSPIEPPWRVLPYPRHAAAVCRRVAVPVVTSRAGLADVNAIGRTLDLFV